MNTALLILLVIFFILVLYYLVILFNPDYLVRDPVSLTGVKTINSSELDSPGSPRYYYEGWFYINANAPADTENILFNRGTDFICALKGSTIKVYVNCPATTTIVDGVVSSPSNELISIQNVPFQKWMHLVLHVDSSQIDAYVDGKLAQSNKHSTIINSTGATALTYGNKHTVGKVVRFKRPATNINPQSVYSSYMIGSGQGNTGMPNTHVKAQITKNNVVKVNQQIF
jgi:hypothetical protein